MRTVILASMRTYARRYVAALLAVVIATAFIVAINALSAAARDGSGQAVGQQYGRADLVIAGTGDLEEFDDLVRRAAAVEGVAAVAVDWSAYASATLPDGPRDLSLGSIATSPALRWQNAAAGRLPAAGSDDEIALSTSEARRHGVVPGDTLSLDLPGGDRRMTVTGTVDDLDAPLSAAGYLPEHALGGLGDIAGPIDAVVAVDGDASIVRDALAITGSGSVVDGDAYRETLRLDATRGIDVFQKLIYVFAGISLFVGALVIANTFTILLAQRARDLALLRCVGAVRSQVARSVVVEGVLLGVVGSTAGVLLGLGVAAAGVALIGRLSPATPMGTPSLTVASVAVPVLLGIAVTAAGAYLPAQRAGAQSPLGALQHHDVVELRTRSGIVRLAVAAALVTVGGAGLAAGPAGSLLVGMIGGMLSFVGILLLAPVIVPATIRAAGPLARRLGLAGRLAHVNSLRNPRRTAATSTALLIGVTLITAVVVGSASISHKVNTSLDVNNPIDLTATATSMSAIPDRVAADIARVDGVEGVAALPGMPARVGGEDVDVLGVDDAALALVHGTPSFAPLDAGTIVLPSTTSAELSTSGETVTVTIGGETRDMTVAYATGIGDSPLVSRQMFDAIGATSDGTRAVWVRAAGSADPSAVAADVTAVASTADLAISGGLPERADVLQVLDVMLTVTIGLLAVAVLIALIGVGNTLSLSVLERVRENSLLRALGLRRSGLRAMLAIEALLMAGVAAVLGVALGTTYAWFGLRTASVGVFRTVPDLTIPWGQMGVILAVAALAGLAACVLPARRAARVAPAAGLVAD